MLGKPNIARPVTISVIFVLDEATVFRNLGLGIAEERSELELGPDQVARDVFFGVDV